MPTTTSSLSTLGTNSTVFQTSVLPLRSRSGSNDHRRSTSRINWPDGSNAQRNTRSATTNSSRLSDSPETPLDEVRLSSNADRHVRDVKTAAKKRKGGVLSLLTMKEPSALALAEYAEAQKRLASEKGGRNDVSSQRLPAHAPRVNSKWNGLPVNSTQRPKTSGSDGKKRYSTITTTTSRSDKSRSSSTSTCIHPSSRNGYGLYDHSRSSSVVLPIPLSSEAVELEHEGLAIQELPSPMVYPALRADGDRSRTFLNPPTPPAHLQTFRHSAGEPPMSELEDPDTPSLFELDAVEDSGVLHELPPVTGADVDEEAEEPSPSSPDDLPSDLVQPQQITQVEASDTFLNSDTDQEERPAIPGKSYLNSDTDKEDRSAIPVKSYLNSDTDQEDRPAIPVKSPNRPTPINFSRPMRRRLSRRPSLLDLHEDIKVVEQSAILEEVQFSSTLKNSDGQIDPFLTDTFAAHSRVTGRITEKIPTPQPTTSNSRVIPAGRTLSSDSQITTLSSITATSHHTMTSPTFSAGLSESTRPSSSGSTTNSDTSTNHYVNPLSPRRSDSNASSRAPSIAPSVAGSVMSARWRLSSKERLGLGGKMKKGYLASPWDVSEHLTSDNAEVVVAGSGASPMTTNMSASEAKRKRLSFRLGGKR